MKAQDAERLMADESFAEAFQLLRNRYHRDFENTDPRDADDLLIIRLKFDLIRDVFSEVKKVMNMEKTN